MTQFVKCREGWINLAFAARLREDWNPTTERRTVTLFDADNGIIGSEGDLDVYSDLGALVPAAAGSFAVIVYGGSGDDEQWTEYVPIVAWRIDQTDMPSPVLVDGATGGGLVLIPASDGTMISQGDQTFSNLAAAQAYWREVKSKRA